MSTAWNWTCYYRSVATRLRRSAFSSGYCARVSHARRSIGDYMNLYNQRRPHSSLEDRTPDEVYFATLPAIKSAA
ncbi:integrase core domain-containing protein [Burkholderia cenocepacia]|uniref:integrase core domain-containing protein n=1 Tax=Burkholderia cenocepacia TaxID=95486 RepID=UPI000F5A73BC|nr:hypothetical protein DF143_32600 [Burkholderia cenocepacia]RQV35068.1 hypothetical protein DF033_31920 [Burkholderia cenocepacia]